MRVLVLAGTGEGRRLTERLAAVPGLDVVPSLAGRVASPHLPPGVARVGGFSGTGVPGPDGLAAYLSCERIGAVVDATHPFATRMTAHALAACAATGTPLLVLRRPGWTARAGDDWRRVPDLVTAAAAAGAAPPGAVLLTVGRRDLSAFAGDAAHHYVIRSVDPPDDAAPLPPRRAVILARGPFTLGAERALLDRHDVTLLVTRDSGGEATAAKLDAARDRGIPVLMVDRPPLPPTGAGPPPDQVASVAEASAWVLRSVGNPSST